MKQKKERTKEEYMKALDNMSRWEDEDFDFYLGLCCEIEKIKEEKRRTLKAPKEKPVPQQRDHYKPKEGGAAET